jgi:hypothetical protein
MAGQTVNLPAHFVAGGAPGTAMVGPNTRVKGQLGFLGVQADALTFAGGTGAWTSVNTRTRSQGVFLVSQSSVGSAVIGNSTPPVLVVTGDPRIRSL